MHHRLGECVLLADQEREDAAVALLFHYLVADVLDRHSTERRFWRGFPHHRVPGNRGDEGIPGPDRHRKIERGDHAIRPKRSPWLFNAMLRRFRLLCLPVNIAGLADREAADITIFWDIP